MGVLNEFLTDSIWRNIHQTGGEWVVFELRIADGRGIRWQYDSETQVWVFRGFLEQYRSDGHETRWGSIRE